MRKQQKDKNDFLIELLKVGNVFTACGKTKIPRATVYRWKKEDHEFAKKFDGCQQMGRDNMCDIAEGVIYNAVVADKDVKAAQFILIHNHPKYFPKKPELPIDKGIGNTLADFLKKTFRMKKKEKLDQNQK